MRHYHFGYFWRTPTHMLCSIKTTCCAASLSRRRSYSSRRGLTGNCYRALSRSLSKQVNDFARRITEAQLFERSGYRVTSEERVCYRATMLLSGRSGVQTRRRGCHAWRLPGAIREESKPGPLESINADVAGASSQQMLRMLQPLLPEKFT